MTPHCSLCQKRKPKYSLDARGRQIAQRELDSLDNARGGPSAECSGRMSGLGRISSGAMEQYSLAVIRATYSDAPLAASRDCISDRSLGHVADRSPHRGPHPFRDRVVGRYRSVERAPGRRRRSVGRIPRKRTDRQ